MDVPSKYRKHNVDHTDDNSWYAFEFKHWNWASQRFCHWEN